MFARWGHSSWHVHFFLGSCSLENEHHLHSHAKFRWGYWQFRPKRFILDSCIRPHSGALRLWN
jgi:hypothetical protein